MPGVTKLRLATWNIFSGRTREGDRVDLDLTLATLRALDADVVALQEVDRDQDRSGRADQARVLADGLGMGWRFAPALSGTPGGAAEPPPPGAPDPGGAAYGVALLSRLPLGREETVRLPRAGRDEPRVALVAAAGRPTPLTVAATHLTFVPGSNAGQLRALQRHLAAWPPPRLLLGDLNLWLPLVRAVSLPGWRPLARGRTWPNRPPATVRPEVQLDHVLASGPGVRLRRSRVQAGPASDHRAVVVEVELDLPDPAATTTGARTRTRRSARRTGPRTP
ncbi:MAG TPA: endonuclease/exonuclease/phosphatase family protein [Actinomycetota bacterium]|nr:endonuclease/exonuclease/phosphatase family protein [Actinomycetota bacterium]